MKIILILSLLAPNLLLGQGTPDTGNSKLWEMRKKVQQRSAQRTGSYVEQMNRSLQSGDAEGAETALKAAIAQGTLTQTQINDARGRIDSMVSQQRQAMVAEARLWRRSAWLWRMQKQALHGGLKRDPAAPLPPGGVVEKQDLRSRSWIVSEAVLKAAQ